MNESPTNRRRALEIATVVLRWFLGAVFIYTGLEKALHPVEFLKLVRAYEMVQNHFCLNLIAALLPWFEVFCGLLLGLGIAVRGTALWLTLLLGAFTGLVFQRALAVQSLQHIAFCAVKFDCGCGTGEVFICHKLAENVLLILLAAWLLSGYGRRACIRHRVP